MIFTYSNAPVIAKAPLFRKSAARATARHGHGSHKPLQGLCIERRSLQGNSDGRTRTGEVSSRQRKENRKTADRHIGSGLAGGLFCLLSSRWPLLWVASSSSCAPERWLCGSPETSRLTRCSDPFVPEAARETLSAPLAAPRSPHRRRPGPPGAAESPCTVAEIESAAGAGKSGGVLEG